MPEYTTTIPIPEPITPRELLDDPVEGFEVKPLGDTGKHAAVSKGGVLLAIGESEAKAKRKAKDHVGEHPPFVDQHGNVLEVDFGDVLRLASRRPWIGRDPAQATLMIEVFREYREAHREGRPMNLTKEQVELATKALSQKAQPEAGDGYLAAAYTPVVVSQIHEHLVKRFQKLAEGGADDAESKPAEPKANDKSNGAKAPAKKTRKRK